MNSETIPDLILNNEQVKKHCDRVSLFWGKIGFFQQVGDQPNQYRIDTDKYTFWTASIFSKKDYRAKDGLVHALLHLELFRLGYPLIFPCQKDISQEFVSQVNDSIQHKVMLHLFTEMGFESTYLSPSEMNSLIMNQKSAKRLNSSAPMKASPDILRIPKPCLQIWRLRSDSVHLKRKEEVESNG